jgi:hypothetical protein
MFSLYFDVIKIDAYVHDRCVLYFYTHSTFIQLSFITICLPGEALAKTSRFPAKLAKILLFKCQYVTNTPLFPRNATNHPHTPIFQESQ